MERNAAIRIGAGRPIFQVAFDRTADCRKLAADLMMSPRKKLYLYKMVAIGILQHFILETCQLRAVLFAVVSITLVLFLISVEPVLQFTFLRIGPGTYESPVSLMHVTVTEHRIEPFQALGSFGKDSNSAYRTVEPVRNADKNMAGLGIPLSDESLEGLTERFVPRLVALDNFPHPLVQDKKMIVLIQNTSGNIRKFFCRQ